MMREVPAGICRSSRSWRFIRTSTPQSGPEAQSCIRFMWDRFCNGDVSNDVETGEYFYLGDVSVQVTDWDKIPASMGVREFYGGDLKGVVG